jgi:hypothetical protein
MAAFDRDLGRPGCGIQRMNRDRVRSSASTDELLDCRRMPVVPGEIRSMPLQLRLSGSVLIMRTTSRPLVDSAGVEVVDLVIERGRTGWARGPASSTN